MRVHGVARVRLVVACLLGGLAVFLAMLALQPSIASADGSGVPAAGGSAVPAAPVPLGMGGGGPRLTGHGADSAVAPSSLTTPDGIVPEDTGGTPEDPSGLTEIPLLDGAVDSTTPTFAATYNNDDDDSGYVEYEVLTSTGTVLATGDGDSVAPGDASRWTYPVSDPPLQIGEDYEVEAKSVSGSDSTGFDVSDTFSICPAPRCSVQPD